MCSSVKSFFTSLTTEYLLLLPLIQFWGQAPCAHNSYVFLPSSHFRFPLALSLRLPILPPTHHAVFKYQKGSHPRVVSHSAQNRYTAADLGILTVDLLRLNQRLTIRSMSFGAGPLQYPLICLRATPPLSARAISTMTTSRLSPLVTV
jgi:hypothetical protein